MNKTLTLVTAVVLALTSSGCIANMGDLRDNVSAAEENLTSAAIDATEATTAQTSPRPNETVKLPPVARMAVFGSNGALIFKSNFQAESPAEIVRVDQDATLNFIAGDSEAIERGATITGFAWSLSGKPIEGAGQATVTLAEAGIQVVKLVVTDSNGKTDDVSLKLGVAPKPVEIVTELLTGPVAGASGLGNAGEVTFDLTLAAAGVPAVITSVKFVASPPASCDAILTVVDSEGEEVGSVDNTGNGEAETVSAGALAEGAYLITVGPFACAAPDGVPVSVTVIYTPVIEGLEADHGEHGGH